MVEEDHVTAEPPVPSNCNITQTSLLTLIHNNLFFLSAARANFGAITPSRNRRMLEFAPSAISQQSDLTEKKFSFGKHQNGTSADRPASGSASAAAASRTSRATASISAGYKPDIGQYQKSCNMSNPVLMSKIKERICEMDLVTQMDKAKELTHFALTHQAISKEDKE